MKRFIIFFLFVFSLSVSAQQAKPIVFREEVYDFGSVRENGGPVIHEFQFTNTTNKPIQILSVQPSCGCTTPSWSPEAIPSGKTGYIQASYDPKGRPGYFNKTLTVTTDFDSNPVVLQIKGNVSTEGVGSEADFKVQVGGWNFKSTSFNMGKVYLNDEATVRDFPFLNTGAKPITVAKIVGPAYIKTEVTPKTILPGEKGHVKLIYYGKKKNEYGFQTDNVEIHTDDDSSPLKSFTVYATLEDDFSGLKPEDMKRSPRLSLSTSSMDFGRVGNNATINREITVTNVGKKELLIKSVQGNCSCIAASAAKSSLKPGETTQIRITFDSQDRKATQTKAVTIYSNDPQGPVQRFTFTAYVEN
jgi:hypothetical protein